MDAQVDPALSEAQEMPILASCQAREIAEPAERLRAVPLRVPASLADQVSASLGHFAIRTLGGGTYCLDTSAIVETRALTLSEDGRFLSFDWTGYESYGHIIVDRTGAGREVEIGETPVFSYSGRRFAVAQADESGFGSLSGFAVWQIDANGLREIGRDVSMPELVRMRIDHWSGEDCIDLSALHWDDLPTANEAENPALYRHLIARAENGWKLVDAPKGGCHGR